MRKIICLLVLVGLFLSGGTCFAQQLTDWEWKVYYDVTEEYYTSSIPRGEGYLDKVKRKIANEHGISIETLEDIVSRGVDREPTEREWGIVDDLWDETAALGKNASQSGYKRVYQRVADKYGITLRQLYEIDYRAIEWEL